MSLTRDDLDTALDDTNATMARVFASQTDFDVAKSDVQTTGLSMTPVYDYHQYSPPTIRGYRVSERARVLVKDLKQGGRRSAPPSTPAATTSGSATSGCSSATPTR